MEMNNKARQGNIIYINEVLSDFDHMLSAAFDDGFQHRVPWQLLWLAAFLFVPCQPQLM